MNSRIASAIKRGELILFLGAGASFGSQDASGKDLLMSNSLAEELASSAGLPYDGEPLSVVYEAVRDFLGNRLNNFLEGWFRYAKPSPEYLALARYVWRRIYTLNIDDALDSALIRVSPQQVNIRIARDPVSERNAFFETLDFIKLNGSVSRLHDGLIFSPSEYARATTSSLPWYTQCASDFVRSPVLFIGTTLDEPLLKFHIERYQSLNPEALSTSYLIAKSATPIQIASLKKYKIEFIQGTLADFLAWLQAEVPDAPRPLDVACESIPQLRALLGASNRTAYADLFEHVLPVASESFSVPQEVGASIRDFYKGFKPEWADIVQGVPAELDVLSVALGRAIDLRSSSGRVLPLLGPAGAGKSTVLMQMAWKLCHVEDTSVYFLEGVPPSLFDTLLAIESAAQSSVVYVCLDNLEFFTEQLESVLKSGRLKKTVILGAERENVWAKRAKQALQGTYEDPIYIRDFSQADALKILKKLELFGSWTRLGKMRPAERLRELLDRSRKQLLIALLEATLGRGFEKIIEDEYAQILNDDERLFLIAVAIATDRRCEAPMALMDRALEKLGVLQTTSRLADDLVGIVHSKRDGLSARHPVYARYLLERVVDPVMAAKAINGLLLAFADYKAPVIQNIPKNEAVLYKGIINHKFLYDLLNGRKALIIPAYAQLEKRFERDGLFWLQYGLALRDFQEDGEALEKLRIAYEAYPMPHTQHALAQQLLQVALLSDEKSVALGLAEEAKAMLEKLDDVIDSDDTYPVVTLGEGYTAVLQRHVSDGDARNFARGFSVVLGQRVKMSPDKLRLKEAYERLFKYASTGVWGEV